MKRQLIFTAAFIACLGMKAQVPFVKGIPVNKPLQSITFENEDVQLHFNEAQTMNERRSDVEVRFNPIEISEAKGWFESLYAKFEKYPGAKCYNAYVRRSSENTFTLVDQELIRDYGTYGRVDVVGLPAADYVLRIVPVDSAGNELSRAASKEMLLPVKAYDRRGFAHKTWTAGIGAYNNDGSLKQGAKVIYLTARNAKNVTAQLSSGTFTGIQAILTAYEKGNVTTPLAIRIIGKLSGNDVDSFGSKEEGLQVKGRSADSELNITIEGIGDDATIFGFGFLLRNAKSVEMRNLALMQCMDDGISLDTDNSNIWIHHIDAFYGRKGSGDKFKGDGAIDVKSDSKYVTIDNCHFWDTGKSSMCGMKKESGPNYITYHHNWFDHSDSRHARVRTMSVHLWNNYFDNVAKYGVGAATGSSVFVENNYFLATKKPILSSLQGTDALGSGTFSGENGGMVKAYGNYFDRQTKNFRYYTQANPATTGYDAYETSTRDEQVPATEVARAGGTAYDNFDTNANVMYDYQPDAVGDVPAIVTSYYGAGRLNHGDVAYTFKDNVGNDETDSEIDPDFEAIILNYQSKLVGFFGEKADEQQPGGDNPGGDPVINPVDEDIILCSFDKSGTPSSTFFDVSGNGSNSKGEIEVDGVVYNTCLKMEMATSVKFTLTDTRTMTLYFGPQETASIKINGNAITGAQGNTYTTTLTPDSYELKRDKTVNLFLIKLIKETE